MDAPSQMYFIKIKIVSVFSTKQGNTAQCGVALFLFHFVKIHLYRGFPINAETAVENFGAALEAWEALKFSPPFRLYSGLPAW